MRVVKLLETLIQGEQTAQCKDDNRDDERVNVTVTAVTERVLLVGLLAGGAATQKKQNLVTGVSHRVDALGQHRGGTGQGKSQELQDGDTEVRPQGGNNRPGSRVAGMTGLRHIYLSAGRANPKSTEPSGATLFKSL